MGDNSLEDKILKQLFLQRLSANAQSILASMADTASVKQLADLADKIVKVSPPLSVSTASIEVPATYHPPQAHSDVVALQDQVAALTDKFRPCRLSSSEGEDVAKAVDGQVLAPILLTVVLAPPPNNQQIDNVGIIGSLEAKLPP